MGVPNPLRPLVDGVLRRPRRIWHVARRAHIETRVGAARAEVGQAAAEAVARLDGVEWAKFDAVTTGVLVALEADADLEPVVAAVEQVERDHGTQTPPFDSRHGSLPGDAASASREALALAADGAAFGFAVTGRLARLARLPIEVASVVSLVQSQPRLRRPIEAVVGPTVTDVALGLGNAVGQALAQGPLSLLVDGVTRVSRVAENQARREAWRLREQEIATASVHVAEAAPPDRIVPLPAGPVERYADQAGLASLGGLAVLLPITRDPRRASAAALATMPKAAQHGRDVFAAHLGRLLARRGVICFDPDMLRRLDRIDCLAIDGAALISGGSPAERRLQRGAEPLVDTARRAGYAVVIAGEQWIAQRLDADVIGGGSLVNSVRRLQHEGHGVALVSRTDPNALRVADCGIGLVDGALPWAADLVVWDLEAARLTLEAAGVAYEVSRQSVAISLGGASVGSVLALTGLPAGSGRRAMAAVNVAALLAQANAIRAAVGLGRRPVRIDHDQPPWHELDADAVLARLATSRKGLSASEADRRRPPAEDDEPPSLPGAVAGELANPLTPVLAGAAALSGVVGSVTDAVVVGSVTALNGVLGGVQRFRVDRAVRALDQCNKQPVRVVRDGTVESVLPDEVVPGDVVRLDAGDAVPADARILNADGLEVDESSVTGESVPIEKGPTPSDSTSVADRTSMLWAGTAIAAGSVEAAIVATGDATEAGRAEAESDDADASERAGVEARLRDLTRLTLPVSFIGGAAVTAVGLLRRVPLRETLQTGVSLAVAAVPEGLPILATMAQLASARRLAQRGALVRNPRAIEALGRVDVLCADKTGTLTEGRLALRLVSDGDREWKKLDELEANARRLIAVGLRASPSNHGNDGPLPHLTDQAVVDGATRLGLEESGDDDHWKRIAELPFEPARSYHAVLGENGRGSVLSVKGAPEVVLPRCTTWHRGGNDHELTTSKRKALLSRVDELGLRGYRVLAVAEREASSRQDLDDERVDRLRLLGFLGLSDQLRPTAADAAAALQRAGVDVVILTGDHPSTAEGIGAELGILNGGRVFTGQEIDELDDDALVDALDDVAVFARVTPAHKVRLVNAYRRAGRTVAMTGDGANDAPAIKLADTGIAVGENSTSAARQAADLVVPDGRIETVVDALIEGRAMWSSVRDAIAILLGGNLGEIGFTLAGAAVTGRSPLNARQLLLVNLLTDVLPATAVALRPPQQNGEDLVRAGPDAALGRSLNRSILVRAVTTGGGAGTAWIAGRLSGRRRRASTVGLAALVGTQLGQTAISGGRDPFVLAASAGSAALLFTVVQTPGLSHLFGCTPLGPVGWSIAAASSTAATAASAVVPKLVPSMRALGPK
jgi:cation-transporting P-type ATPase I